MKLLPKKIKNEERITNKYGCAAAAAAACFIKLSFSVRRLLPIYLSDQGFVVLQFLVFLFELNSKLNYSLPMNRCSSLC